MVDFESLLVGANEDANMKIDKNHYVSRISCRRCLTCFIEVDGLGILLVKDCSIGEDRSMFPIAIFFFFRFEERISRVLDVLH